MAAPFVQGRLRKKRLSIEIRSECASCARTLRLVVGSDLKHQVIEGSAKSLLFEPEVDWATFDEPNITQAYCRNSLFFCSEEHAQMYRQSRDQVDGAYLTLNQSAYSTPIAQGGLFAF